MILALKVLELLDAAENVKAGVMNGDEVVIGKVEKAVGKVAMGIDIYLILAVSRLIFSRFCVAVRLY